MTSTAVVVVGDCGGGNSYGSSNGSSNGSSYRPVAFPELCPVANRPVLFRALDAMRDAGIRQAVLVLAPGGDPAVRAAVGNGQPFGVEVTYVQHDPKGGLGADLEQAGDFLHGQSFVLHFCDSLAKAGLAPLISVNGMRPFDAVLLVRSGREPSHGVVEFTNGRLATLVPGAAERGGLGTLAGVGVFGKGLQKALRDVDGRAAIEVQLLAGVERMRSLGGKIQTRPVGDWWRFDGQQEPLLEANRFLLEGLRPSGTKAAMSASDIQGSVAIADTVTLESTIIRGPAVIGPRVQLRDAYVGPYTSIGADVVVEGAELENSIILPGARISHVGARVESSVIGRGAKIFRDFRLPKALRLHLGEGAEVSLT